MAVLLREGKMIKLASYPDCLDTNPPRELAHVRRALSGPMAITEDGLALIWGIVEAHTVGQRVEFKAAQPANDDESGDLGFDLENGVATIKIEGPIFPKSNLMTQFSGAVSLEDLKAGFTNAAASDPAAIIGSFDSPGGSVSGLTDFAAWLHDFCQSQDCPCIALVNPLCASAALMIATQMDQVLSTSGGLTGSLGVIAAMDNRDRQDKNAGNDRVVIRSSELKAPGVGAITPAQHTDLQRMVAMHFGQFQEAVQRGRPGIDIDAASTGQMWPARDPKGGPTAQSIGLIDGISTIEKLKAQYGRKKS